LVRWARIYQEIDALARQHLAARDMPGARRFAAPPATLSSIWRSSATNTRMDSAFVPNSSERGSP
jgi:hypothetical protein